MKKIFILMMFFLIGNPALGVAEENLKELPLDEFIRLAAQNDTAFQEILIDELALQYRKALRIPAQDLVLEVKSQYGMFMNSPDEGGENTVSLTKLFPYSGTEVSAEYSSSLRATSHSVASGYSFLISQAIAENAFGKSTRLLDKIVGMEVEIAGHQIVEAYEDYLATLTQRYYDWYSAYENVKTAENSYKENNKLLENIKDRQRNSIALPIDVNKINLQVLAKEENLISLRNTYSRYLNLIKEAIRYQSPDEIIPKVPSLYEEIVIDFTPDYRAFTESSRTYRVLNMLEEKSGFEVSRDADALLPSIELFVGFSAAGEGHDVVPTERKTYAGVNVELPLPGQVERAQYETTKIAAAKTQLSTESTYARLYADLKNLYDQIQRERRLISVAEDKITLAERIVEDEKQNYSYGRSTLNDLIDEVNKLEDNKFNRILHTVQLKKLIVEWLRLTDRLITREKILTSLENLP